MAIEKQTVKTKYLKILKPIAENEKCPPQAKLIVSTIEKAGGKIERGELLTLLRRTPEEGGLTTRQSAERILGFYKPVLKTMGVMVEETETTEVEVEVPDKPAKEAKEAKPAAGAKTKKVKGVKGTEATAEGAAPAAA